MSKPVAKTGEVADWLRLQRKIFSRWVNLKLAKKGIPCNDVVTDIGDGKLLIALMEVLSEKPYDGKVIATPKLRPHKLDNLTNALKLVWSSGVDVKLKPSAEDLADGNQQAILGLIWAIMSKYIKIGDEDEGEQLNAKDALLMWIQNKVASYAPKVKVDKFKDLQDGLALCALIHKHRPKLVPFDQLNQEDKIKNLTLAIDAAEQYFGLEKYLSPEDIPKLDENGLVVYLSEFYYGIAEQRRIDLAARRISKVIKLTKENDALKEEFKSTGQRFLDNLKRVEKVLEDRSIDNTMAGAKRKIEEFYTYKSRDKNVIMADQLQLEALYNTLSMRLAHNKRPEFVPPAGLTLKDITAAVVHLEECEKERSVSLHAELNRQIKLVQMDEQHRYRFEVLEKWIGAKTAYLETKENIQSVSQAQLHIRLLDAFDKESLAIKSGTVAPWEQLGKELLNEKYEKSGEVKTRMEFVENSFKSLGNLSQQKRPVLEDDLAREQYKEKVRQAVDQFRAKDRKLQHWIKEKEDYLKTKESVTSVGEARAQLSILAAYEKDKKTMTSVNVSQLDSLGKEILGMKYKTKYSEYVWEHPEEINSAKDKVHSKWKELSDFSAEKKRVLDDHLAREEYKEETLSLNANHVKRHQELESWISEKENYLKLKEESSSIAEAQSHLDLLDEFDKEKDQMHGTSVFNLKDLGKEILARKYSTNYSSYAFENPQEILSRENSVDSAWGNLASQSSQKRQILAADLAQEIEKERLRLEFAHQASEYIRWTSDVTSDVKVSHFGFNLEEVENYAQVLANEEKSIKDLSAQRSADFNSTWEALQKLQVKDNNYTTLDPVQLENAFKLTQSAIAERRSKYEAELSRQRANDALCKEFASVAEPLSTFILKMKEMITTSNKELEAQLAFVETRINSASEDAAPMGKLKELDAKMAAAEIVFNRHTSLTLKDVDVMWQQYLHFLNGKKKMLQEEIENSKLRGITAEQFEEIRVNFNQFDTDKSGTISRKELKALLYSLGEEKTAAEIQSILKEYGKDAAMPYEGFREFMIKLLGDSNTKDEILEGFRLILKGINGPSRSEEQRLTDVMSDDDVSYLKENATWNGGVVNFEKFTEEVFAR
eukprot:TRINITY_DN2527_c0_g1_i1.p1 TRINITY_DN2527_c0_g1~~TRINITY_DN2527_c0_g1_i1.p1  ORF type:complete len:1111 (+),score=542.58 TRINITY_DN2527_c0_g1_i1:57-3389(+)